MTSNFDRTSDYYIYFENPAKFQKEEPTLYNKVLSQIKIEPHAAIYLYHTPEDYAKFSVKEGYYVGDVSDSPLDFTEFIDYPKLAKYFLSVSDKGVFYYDESSNKFVEVLN